MLPRVPRHRNWQRRRLLKWLRKMAARSKTVERCSRGSDNSRWMEKLPKELHEVPLNHLAIPGSHNSLTSWLDVHGFIAPDQAPWIQVLGNLTWSTRSIVKSWSTVQSLSVCEQLNAGIRYFDIRVGAKLHTQSGELCAVHGLYGPSIETSLNEIASFLGNHKSEVILLDFNHFYEVSDVAHQSLIGQICRQFGSKLCPRMDAQKVTLKFMSGHGHQLIVFYHHYSARNCRVLWPGSCIPSPWPQKIEVSDLMDKLKENYQKVRDMSQFYVTQGVLTPDANYIKWNLLWTLKTTLAPTVAKPFVKWLKSKQAGPDGINICIMDCVELENYISEVIQLNYSLLE